MEPTYLRPTDTFARRHIGPSPTDVKAMLAELELDSLDQLIQETVPESIRLASDLALGRERGEAEFLDEFRLLASRNKPLKSLIGLGYHGTHTPGVILRNIIENPGWYTQYTPYQAEISQGRLEALLNFQTVVADLCALPLANASLLDEGTAAAEALCLCHRALRGKRNTFFVSQLCLPQTIAVVRTRAEALAIEVIVGDHESFDPGSTDLAGCLLQYPACEGELLDYEPFIEKVHAAGALACVATDLLALTVLRPPGEFGADVAIGSAQRFGVPLGFGGPHAAFLATTEDHRRQVPGRIIGLSRDAHGKPALRMALQTREQHIRREKATSNICTAQALLAIVASMYAVYHGPEGLRAIAERIHGMAAFLRRGLKQMGFELRDELFFDTFVVGLGNHKASDVLAAAVKHGLNLRALDANTIAIAFDETVTREDVVHLFEIFGELADVRIEGNAFTSLANEVDTSFPAKHARSSPFLQNEVFHSYHSEHEILRYIKRLEVRDLSLTTSMIPLGSCTMKLNATSEMVPLTWPEFGAIHPFAPADQWEGYAELFRQLESQLCEITGFDAFSLQPNAGSQGEYAGLLAIRAYHRSRGDGSRDICLIPVSAHGTNPASAIMAGLRVVTVACDEKGNIDVTDLEAKIAKHVDKVAALMVTYPSTHGVFEEAIRTICEKVHAAGAQVYMDGANMNAQVGLCRPSDFGADVCHLNLHKTFCIPHGGGGPGMGPIGVEKHLAPFLPSHPILDMGGTSSLGTIAAAPWGSPSVLTISYAYICMMGAVGLKRATEVAILNANYMKERLSEHFPVLYTGEKGRVAHEFILDLRPFEKSAGISGEDVAKRLMDYGFHAPTMSFPVAGTLMIEPTESESKAELDRLCDALIMIRGEVRSIEEGRLDREDNPLHNAPHTSAESTSDEWSHDYSREQAAFPTPWTREHKFWPPVARIDNGFGDRNLVCTCPPTAVYEEEEDPAPAQEPVSSGA